MIRLLESALYCDDLQKATRFYRDTLGLRHLAFAVSAAELPAWEARLGAANVPIEHRVTWDRGGSSIYFRDPDGHLVELATPGVWEIY